MLVEDPCICVGRKRAIQRQRRAAAAASTFADSAHSAVSARRSPRSPARSRASVPPRDRSRAEPSRTSRQRRAPPPLHPVRTSRSSVPPRAPRAAPRRDRCPRAAWVAASRATTADRVAEPVSNPARSARARGRPAADRFDARSARPQDHAQRAARAQPPPQAPRTARRAAHVRPPLAVAGARGRRVLPAGTALCRLRQRRSRVETREASIASCASRSYSPTLMLSLRSRIATSLVGTVGWLVKIGTPRYTCIASAETISAPRRAASSSATAVLPEPVGPKSATTS